MINQTTKSVLFFCALGGWLLSLAVHLVAALAYKNPMEKFPLLWLLHPGAILIIIPVVLLLRSDPSIGLKNRKSPKEFLKQVFKNAPVWLKMMAIAGFAYALANFSILLFQHPETPYEINGEYILKMHGKVVRTISGSEYRYYETIHARVFSGHWIAFYGIACAVLYPFRKQAQSTAQAVL